MSAVEFVGAFRSHAVVVDGWQVRDLYATPLNGGRVHLNLDHRFGVDLTIEEAERFIPFLAHCIAVAYGFTAHPGGDLPEPKRRLPFVKMHQIGAPEEA
jgi:hypothetical protein